VQKLYLDFETRSELDINVVGAWKYAMHPSTEIMCMGWAIDEGKIHTTLREALGPAVPIYLAADLIKNKRIIAHSAHFEYAIYNYILHKRYGWPALWEPSYWDCTMARAAMCGLPLALYKLGEALKVSIKKDLEGRAAMLKLCRPITQDPLGDPIYNEDPILYEKLWAYNKTDVESEREIDKQLPELPPMERAIWELDLVINHRGVAVDLDMAQKAAALAEHLTDNLNAQLNELTGGAISKATQVKTIKQWLTKHGINAESLDKRAVNALMEDEEISDSIKAVLSLRRQVGKSSTAKYSSMINAACDDGRVRGALQYHGAHTGRWSGRIIQPQNYPQGLVGEAQKAAIEAIKSGNGLFSRTYGNQAMETLSGALRGTIVAGLEKCLIGADYSAIEARVNFWQAGEIGALYQYARGESPYKNMANLIFKVSDPKKDSQEYKIGKQTVLGCGFQMGAARFKATCTKYGIDVSDALAEHAVKTFRGYYRNVVRLWYATEAAAKNAVRTPGSLQPSGKVVWGMSKDLRFLCCRLPSGRHLRYYKPSLGAGEYGDELRYWAEYDPNTPGKIHGRDGALAQYGTYGGALVENTTQAIARDLMVNGMMNVEKHGFEIILTVHDEILAENLNDRSTHKDLELFIKDLCKLPDWAKDCPITAEGWIGERYRK
jgi:DNA polymerase bacteriophage-type